MQVVDSWSAAARARRATLEALLGGERLASTGVGQSVAIPHVKLAWQRWSLCSIRAACPECRRRRAGQVLFTVLRPEQATDRHDPERHPS